jgi:hypothetical protein
MTQTIAPKPKLDKPEIIIPGLSLPYWAMLVNFHLREHMHALPFLAVGALIIALLKAKE